MRKEISTDKTKSSISGLAIAVTLFGWIIFLSFLYYHYDEYGVIALKHFLVGSPSEIFFRFVILSSLIGSSLTGYLINERKRLLEKARISEKKAIQTAKQWINTFDAMPYGILITDTEFNIVRANRTLAELVGMHVKEVISRKCYEVVHGHHEPIDMCPLQRAVRTRKVEVSEYYSSVINRHLMASTTPVINENGTIEFLIHSLVDVTELKTKEERLNNGRLALFNMLKDLHEANRRLAQLYDDLVMAFSTAIDAKSPWTKGHSERVANYAVAIAQEMGIKEKDIRTLTTASLLHDVGKIGTSDSILVKHDSLTEEEFAIIKKHPVKGIEILEAISGFEHVLPIIRSHHEWYNGSGYPEGLKGEEIPLLARIVSVADAFDAMTAERPYRETPGREKALKELKAYSGIQFDPRVVEAFLKVLDSIP